MEKSINWEFDSCMQETFRLKEVDIREYSPLTLAYIGDSIYDLIMKTLVVNQGNKPVQKLHKETSTYVQAKAQSKMMRVLQEELTEEEHQHLQKGTEFQECYHLRRIQSVTDYRRATGFEAVMGYLYLQKDYARMMELVKMGLKSLEEEQ